MATKVRIFQPAKTAMQSGRANTKRWVLEFEPTEKKVHDDLMGWVGSGDMNGQLRLFFATRKDAESYAKRKGFTYTAQDANPRVIKPKSYSDNFAFHKIS
ncbi:oxidoreductase [Rhodospirillum rubrum]|uniref:ETC complex I subunit n=1 Tax=Rhodospirillum rubrum TaxID=1085 RepID=UPI0019052D8F|nr:ETC complex I subunit [Rhodospirillum rubrum]MBK1664316.1 oxidoreductase [Rhodospirillum rubrum]MBK1677392.1 oxidoreductase [Rhodospirillum rubrum]